MVAALTGTAATSPTSLREALDTGATEYVSFIYLFDDADPATCVGLYGSFIKLHALVSYANVNEYSRVGVGGGTHTFPGGCKITLSEIHQFI